MKKKRSLSAKQKAALKKGQAALKAWRKKKSYKTGPASRKEVKRFYKLAKKRKVHRVKAELAPIIITEGSSSMARHSKRKHHKRRTHKPAMHYFGKAKRHVKHRRKSHSRYMGFDLKQPINMLGETAVAVGGAIVGTMAANEVSKIVQGTGPNALDPRIKALIPVAGGMALSIYGKKIPMSKALAAGMLISGGYSLIRNLIPGLNLPLLSGEDVLMIPSSALQQLSGRTQQPFTAGNVPSFGNNRIVTGADIG